MFWPYRCFEQKVFLLLMQRCKVMLQDQCKTKRAKDSQYFKDKMLLMEAKEKGATLDAEAVTFISQMWKVIRGRKLPLPTLPPHNAVVAFLATCHPLVQPTKSVNEELSREQAYWLPANEIASNASNPATPVTPFVHNRPPPKKDICSIVLTSDIVVPPSSNCLCEDLRSACDREHTKVLELEAEVLKQQKMVIESEKQHVSLQRWYDELTKANTHSRTANTEKLSALTAENTKLKAQVTGKTCSGPSTSESPKVLAPGMYNLGSKYVPPPKRANWDKPNPLPKKKQVTFSELPKPSLKPTPKPVVHPNKQTNMCVPMSTGVKPISGASKTVPKRVPQNHSSLPIKSANALNKKNRVDSNLLVKHSVSVSNLNNVCGACNKSLVVANHNDCLVLCDDSVNVKPHQTKHLKRQPKREWKPIKNVGKPIKRVWKPISKPVANSKPQWKPTGRHFSLFEKYPLTRIMESIDKPIELPPSVSSSSKVTMISRFPDCKLSDRKAGSKGISGFQGQPVADSIADKIETTTTYGKFKRSCFSNHLINVLNSLTSVIEGEFASF
ncbi:hypothetical protein Tco_0027013 [Tanacetum coccineum]